MSVQISIPLRAAGAGGLTTAPGRIEARRFFDRGERLELVELVANRLDLLGLVVIIVGQDRSNESRVQWWAIF